MPKFFLVFALFAIVPIFAAAGDSPISNTEAIELLLQKFSADKNTQAQAELVKSARDDLLAGRKSEAKAKFALLASAYEGLVDEQIAAIQQTYSEAVMNMSGMPWIALQASTGTLTEQAGAAFRGVDPRRLINPSQNGNEYSADRNSMLVEAASVGDESMTKLARFLKSANPRQLANFRNQLDGFELIYREYIESLGQRHSTALRRATLVEISARRLTESKTVLTKGVHLTRMQCDELEGNEKVLRAYVNAETVGQSLFAASMLIGVGEIALGARAALAVVKAGGSAAAKVGWKSAAKAAAAEGAKIATSAAGRKEIAEKFASNIFVRGTHGAARASVGTMAGLNLYEAVSKNGFLGLANLGSALDALTLLAVLPRPTAYALAAREQAESLKVARIFGKSQGVKLGAVDSIRASLIDSRASVLKTIVTSQHQAGSLVAGVSTSYGVYQIVMAERLAKEMGELGEQVSPEQVKKQGMANILMGIMGGKTTFAEYKAWAGKSPKFVDMLSSSNMGPTLGRLGAQFKKNWVWFPVKSLFREGKIVLTGKPTKAHAAEMDAVEAAKPFLEQKPSRATPPAKKGFVASIPKRLGGLANMAGSTIRIAYDLAAYHAFTLISFSYPDKSFRKNQRPLPDLKPGEIAPVLSSFDNGDLLKGAMKTVHSLRTMRDRYQEGVNYFEDEFADPADLIRKIQFYSTHFGKIRVLELKAHGVPGMIATRSLDVSGSGASGVIDADYMKKHAAGIQWVASQAFAEDAAVYIFSCMVGSNLDRPMLIGDHPAILDPKTGSVIKPASKGILLPVRSGDDFIREFKRTFLVNGGTVDSSRRMIAAFDAVHGSGFHAALLSGIKKNPKALQELRDYLGSEGSFLLDPSKDTESSRADYLAGIGSKVIAMYKKMWTLIRNYGINLEGGFFSDHHRIDRAEPSSASPMTAAQREKFADDFLLARLLTPAEQVAFLEGAAYATELSGQPKIEADLREMLESNRIWINPSLEDQIALTFLAHKKKPWMHLGRGSAWLNLSKQMHDQNKNPVTRIRNQEDGYTSLVDAYLGFASSLAHEWFHASQGFDYRMKTKGAQVEWEAYSFEVTLYREALKLYGTNPRIGKTLENSLEEIGQTCKQVTGRAPKDYQLTTPPEELAQP